MNPTAQECFCPKSSLKFFKDWMGKNKIKFNTFSTPKGTVLFCHERKFHRSTYKIMSPITQHWTESIDRTIFQLDMAELLAICFRS